MKPEDSKALVIDANIAQAAGDTDDPVSMACRTFLQQVISICHKVVLTRDITDEWNEHQGKFACRWRKAMTSKKKIRFSSNVEISWLREMIAECGFSTKQRDAMLKDIHLIEAAAATDNIVVSRDKKARDLFRRLFMTGTQRFRAVHSIMWIDPTQSESETEDWLRRGAEPVKEWRIDHSADSGS